MIVMRTLKADWTPVTASDNQHNRAFLNGRLQAVRLLARKGRTGEVYVKTSDRVIYRPGYRTPTIGLVLAESSLVPVLP